jgi:hypothetical protein
MRCRVNERCKCLGITKLLENFGWKYYFKRIGTRDYKCLIVVTINRSWLAHVAPISILSYLLKLAVNFCGGSNTSDVRLFLLANLLGSLFALANPCPYIFSCSSNIMHSRKAARATLLMSWRRVANEVQGRYINTYIYIYIYTWLQMEIQEIDVDPLLPFKTERRKLLWLRWKFQHSFLELF